MDNNNYSDVCIFESKIRNHEMEIIKIKQKLEEIEKEINQCLTDTKTQTKN